MFPLTAGSIPPLNGFSRSAMPTQPTSVCGHGRAPAACRFCRRLTPSCRGAPQDTEAWSIFRALALEFGVDAGQTTPQAELSSVYTRNMYIKNRPINDSFHFGQTLINDFGRPLPTGVQTRWMGFRPGRRVTTSHLMCAGSISMRPGRAAYPGSVQQLIAAVDGTPLLAPETRTSDQCVSLD